MAQTLRQAQGGFFWGRRSVTIQVVDITNLGIVMAADGAISCDGPVKGIRHSDR